MAGRHRQHAGRVCYPEIRLPITSNPSVYQPSQAIRESPLLSRALHGSGRLLRWWIFECALHVAPMLDRRTDKETQHNEGDQFDFIDRHSHGFGPGNFSKAYLPRTCVLKKCPFERAVEKAVKTLSGTSR